MREVERKVKGTGSLVARPPVGGGSGVGRVFCFFLSLHAFPPKGALGYEAWSGESFFFFFFLLEVYASFPLKGKPVAMRRRSGESGECTGELYVLSSWQRQPPSLAEQNRRHCRPGVPEVWQASCSTFLTNSWLAGGLCQPDYKSGGC